MRKAIYKEYSKVKEIERILIKLDIAEAVNAAIIGSTYDKQKKNIKSFKRWKRSLISRYNKLNGIKETTIWDTMKKSRRI